MAPLQPEQHHIAADVPAQTLCDLPSAITDQTVYNVLLTGFGPFHNVKSNPSWQLLKPLQGTLYPTPLGKNIRCNCIELQVAYDTALRVVPSIHSLTPASGKDGALSGPSSQYTLINQQETTEYALVVHLGVAQNRHFISLEQRARLIGYIKPDVEGEYAPSILGPQGQRLQGVIQPQYSAQGGSGELTTSVPLESIIQRLSTSLQADIRVSNDAGLFLCEFTYCTSLACAKLASQQNGSQPTPVLFIHVPDADQPYSLDQLTAIIQAITAEIVDTIY